MMTFDRAHRTLPPTWTIQDVLSNLELVRDLEPELVFLCPFCDDDSGHLYVNRDTGLWHCFVCDAAGWINIPRVRRPRQRVQRPPRETEIDLPAHSVPLWTMNKYRLVCYLARWKQLGLFIVNRRLSYTDIVQHKLYYAERGGHGGRLILPIIYNGQIVCWQGRRVDGREPKYMNPRTPPVHDYLYNFDEACKHAQGILVEGVFDVIKVGPGAFASFGTSITTTQMMLLYHAHFTEIVVMWDSNAAVKAFRLAKMLPPSTNIRVALLGRKDPGELTHAEVVTAIENAMPLNRAMAQWVGETRKRRAQRKRRPR